LQKYLPSLKGEIALQVGSLPMLLESGFEHQFQLLDEPQMPADESHVADSKAQVLYGSRDPFLPFSSSSVDLCLLPHVLEFTANPHQLLRQSREILVSGGHLVIYGFNPYSLWGARALFSRHKFPWNGQNLSVYRLKDWLRLLEFHITGGMMLYYLPPVENRSIRSRFGFMDKAGDRWWPMLGSIYLLVAQKRDVGMTVIDFREKSRKGAFLNIPEPAARTMLNR
jgi:SAM-dependent methyltransferase